MVKQITFTDKKASSNSEFVLVAEGLKGLNQYLENIKLKNPAEFPYEGLVKEDAVPQEDINKIWYIRVGYETQGRQKK